MGILVVLLYSSHHTYVHSLLLRVFPFGFFPSGSASRNSTYCLNCHFIRCHIIPYLLYLKLYRFKFHFSHKISTKTLLSTNKDMYILWKAKRVFRNQKKQ